MFMLLKKGFIKMVFLFERIKKGCYICTRIQGIPDEALRRNGRVVECGSLENC